MEKHYYFCDVRT